MKTCGLYFLKTTYRPKIEVHKKCDLALVTELPLLFAGQQRNYITKIGMKVASTKNVHQPFKEALMIEFIIIYLTAGQVSFREPVELSKLMSALDECIMFDQKETKKRIKESRTKALLPEIVIGGRVEQNDVEANKLAESSPYLLTNLKNGWAVELKIRWSLDRLLFSKEENEIQRGYQNNIERYLSLQNELIGTYYKLKDLIKKLSETKEQREFERLSDEYNYLNAKIDILTCHKYKTIQWKEE